MRLTPQLIKDAEAGKVKLQELALKDHELFCDLNLKIKTKQGALEPFRLNAVQREFDKICGRMLQETGRIRIIVLKGRQFGISTYIDSRQYRGCSTQFNQEGKVVAHDKEAAQNIFEMAQTFYDYSLEEFRPMKKYRSRNELRFENPTKMPDEYRRRPGLKSTMSIYTAGGKGIGRSKTLRYLHCSEVPHWRDPKNTMLGLLNTVPGGEAGKGTEIFIESTANGVGDYFYNKYYAARNHEPGEEFWAVFLPWYLHEEYVSEVPEDFKSDMLTEEERHLVTDEHEEWAYANPATGVRRLSVGQVLWRRQTIATKCDKDPDKFRQEYPLTDDEAFLTAGVSFFNLTEMARREKALEDLKPVFVGEIEWYKSLLKKGKKDAAEIRFVEDQFGRLTLWRRPRPEEAFVFGADVGEGVRGGDESVCDMISLEDGFHCAQWVGLVEPDQFGDVIYNLGRYFNWAYGSSEINNSGTSTIDRLKFLRYPKLYIQRTVDHRVKELTERIGWRTTPSTRPEMLDNSKQLQRDYVVLPNSLKTIQQQKTFVKSDTGKWQAQPGCKDDAVMAFAIAGMMWSLYSGRRKRKNRIEANRVSQGRGPEVDPVTGWPV